MRKNGSGVLSENLVPLTPAKRVIVGLLERDAGLAATRAVSSIIGSFIIGSFSIHREYDHPRQSCSAVTSVS